MDATPASKSQIGPTPGPAPEAVARQTIALVDDDRNILTTVSIALQAEGFATRIYADGQTALKALLENPPDLAIFDIKMPRMDGFELLQRLREKSALPVIFLTSKDEEPDEALGLALGADDYIAKPFSQRLLVARIRAILRRGELVRGANAAADAPPLPDPIQRGRLTMDPARHHVTCLKATRCNPGCRVKHLRTGATLYFANATMPVYQWHRLWGATRWKRE